MPEQQYLNPNSMSQPRGYTQVVKAGNTVYIAGQVSGLQCRVTDLGIWS